MLNNISRVRLTLRRLSVSALALTTVAAAPRALGQITATPIPFISTYAGLASGAAAPANAVCSTSLAEYGTGSKYGDGCPATQASLSTPLSVATDKQGNVFVSDQSHSLIRVIYNGTGNDALAAAIIASNIQNTGLVPVKGNIYTIAGGPTTTPPSHYCNQAGTGPQGDDLELDGCPGVQTDETLNRGVAVDADGNVFLSNGAVYPTIRVFYVGGSKAAALIQLADPAITPQPGYVYKIAGYGGTTLRTTGGACAGTTLTYTDVYGDGCPAALAYIGTPRGLFVDGSENVYFADQGANVVRRIDGTTSIITEVAGCVATTAACGSVNASGDGGTAVGTGVNMYQPYGVALDSNGNVFIAEGGSSSVGGRIRVVYNSGTLAGVATPTQGNIYTYAGGAATSGTQAQMASFQFTYGVAVDASGYVYVTDYRSGTANANHIWRVDPSTGNILIYAGTGGAVFSGPGQHCDRVKQFAQIITDLIGDNCPATQAYLNVPQGGLAFDAAGNAYFADRGNNVVRKLAFNNVFPATAVGAASAALPEAFYFPATTTLLSKTSTQQGAASTEFASTTTANDNCPLAAALPATPDTCVSYVTFTPSAAGTRSAAYNLSDATGVVATMAVVGTGTAPILAITPAAAVTVGAGITPAGVSVDQRGNVYVSDAKGKQVLRSTVAGGAGTAVLTGLGLPAQSTVDNFGTLYVADTTSNKIVKLAAGSSTSTSFGTGLNAPQGVVADFAGNVYIADTGNNRLLYYTPQDGVTTVVSTYPVVLSAPTSLAIDTAGNLYIVDTNRTRVVEVPLNLPATVLTLPAGVTPAAMGFDTANDVYYADTASGNVVVVPAGGTTMSTVVAGLTTPVGLSVATNGNLFVADSTASSVAAYNVAVNNSTFSTTNIPQSSSPVTLTLSDVGNVSATLATPPYTETGSAAFVSSGTATCVAAFVLTPGSTCTQTFVFTPTAPGPQTAKVVFNTTTTQSVTANFNATATNLVNTSIAITPANASAQYGQVTTYSVTLTPTTLGTPGPSGMMTFSVDGKVVSTSPVNGAPYVYSFPVSTSIGMHSVCAVYGGDTVYGGTSSCTFLTVSKATTTTAVSYAQSSAGVVLKAVVTPTSAGAVAFTGKVSFFVDNVSVATIAVNGAPATTTVPIADGAHTYYATYTGDTNYLGSTSTPVQTLTVTRATTTTTLSITATTAAYLLTATVTSATAGTPTGTITFANNGTTLGVVTLANGTASWLTNTATYTSYTFTATYSGDGLFLPSTSSGTDYLAVMPTTVAHIPQGGQLSIPVVLVPINGYTGSITATCSGLPANALCRFYPIPVVLLGTKTVTLNVQVYAGVNPNVSRLARPAGRGFETGAVLALLLFFGVLRRSGRKLPALLALLVLPLITLGVSGCGSIKTPAVDPNVYTTPAGPYAITLTLADANGTKHSNTLNIVVAP